jgi:addiction module RelE/StbE family toxin
MAHKVIWSPTALSQLRQISDYISLTAESHANSVLTRIVDGTRSLEDFPLMGRRVPESVRDDLREILVIKWRIIYEVSQYDVCILQVIHGAQRWRG